MGGDNEGKANGKGLSRRDFMKTTGGMAALAGLTGAGTLLAAKAANASAMPEKWSEEFDIIVVGSGFAGLAAAMEAKKAGASVIVFEKMPVPGGNSTINGGVVSAVGSTLQKESGIADSPELLYKDMLQAGQNLNHPELARIVADKSNEVVQWTISELGVRYRESLVHMGGHSVPRAYATESLSGGDIVRKQLDKLRELGVEVRTRQMLTRLFRDADGRVRGLEVRDGYRFPDAESGSIRHIRAGKAIVLATGGFSNDPVFRIIQNPMLTAEVDSTNQPGATAEALLEALRIGATPVQISWIQVGPWTSPDEKGFGRAPHFVQGITASFGLWVDPATGNRFVNEQADRKVRADAIINTGHPCIAIADAGGLRTAGMEDEAWLRQLINQGVIKVHESLEDLAKAYNIPAAILKQTIETYNGFVSKGKDEDFGKYMDKAAKPLAHPPFYACRVWPKVHHTMGGIQINASAQVIDLEQKPIG